MPNRMFTLDSQEIDTTCERHFLFCVRNICNLLQQLHWFCFNNHTPDVRWLGARRQFFKSVLSRRFLGLASIGAALGGVFLKIFLRLFADTTDSCFRFACKIYI